LGIRNYKEKLKSPSEKYEGDFFLKKKKVFGCKYFFWAG
jgi:hypothetical protein